MANLRERFNEYSEDAELLLYAILGVMLAAGATAALVAAGVALWQELLNGSILTQAFTLLEQLLLVLIFLEILHTVRISIRSHALLMEPFLIVGLIASVRRVLVITLQAAHLVQEPSRDAPQTETLFRYSLLELGLLAILILVFVFSIYLLRLNQPSSSELSV